MGQALITRLRNSKGGIAEKRQLMRGVFGYLHPRTRSALIESAVAPNDTELADFLHAALLRANNGFPTRTLEKAIGEVPVKLFVLAKMRRALLLLPHLIQRLLP